MDRPWNGRDARSPSQCLVVGRGVPPSRMAGAAFHRRPVGRGVPPSRSVGSRVPPSRSVGRSPRDRRMESRHLGGAARRDASPHHEPRATNWERRLPGGGTRQNEITVRMKSRGASPSLAISAQFHQNGQENSDKTFSLFPLAVRRRFDILPAADAGGVSGTRRFEKPFKPVMKHVLKYGNLHLRQTGDH